MKKKILALAISSVLSAGAQAAITDILITEYVEGTANNKAIELTNTGAEYTFTATDTLQYSSYDNVIYDAAKVNVLEGITIAANETIVIANGSSETNLTDAVVSNGARLFLTGTYDEAGYNSLNFNGDDHVALVDDGTILDVIGSDSDWGANKTFRRRLEEGGATPVQKSSYEFNNWNEAVRDVAGTETSENNFTDLGLPTLSAYVVATGPIDLEMIPEDNGSFKATLARYVGQTVILPLDINPAETGDQNMRVARTFSFDYTNFRNNMVLAYKRPNMQPNQENVAGSAAAVATNAQNKDYTLLIEATSSPKDGEIPYYPEFTTDAANNYIRIDDSVIGMEGVISYNSYDDNYTFTVSNTVTSANFTHNTPRQNRYDLKKSLAEVASGDIEIKVATQNVLNYFNSPFGGAQNNHGDNRGATSYSEYEKQKEKIVAAIRGLDADIVGLMEIENNGFGETGAINELVDAINLAYDEPKLSKESKDNSTSNRYAFIGFDSNGDVIIDREDSIGSDAITSGMLYRPAKVTLDAVKIIPMPSQHDKPVVNDNGVVVKNYTNSVLESGDNYMRDSLAATFLVNQTGKKLTVAVNHLKSKGSTCVEDWDGVEFGTIEKLAFNKDKALLEQYGSNDDLQGNCENFRVAAAYQLGEELNKISGDKVIVGDMNSYAQEDPMLVLTENSTAKELKAARNTFIGKTPQFGKNGKVITNSYGYLNAVGMKDAEHGKMSWSYSYEDEIGSLDHILITPSLQDRLVDAVDWHINAPESSLYDYNEDRKGSHAYDFYQGDVYRSSDHDSAIMVLGYTPGEADSGQPVQLTTAGGFIDIPYTIPANAEAKAGDIAEVTLKNQDDNVYVDMSKITSPKVEISEDGQKVVHLELIGAKSSLYTATMTLKREGEIVPNSTVSMTVRVAGADSLEPKVAVPEYDGTGGGGSFGMFSIMSLLGFGFLRRLKAK
ncbi:MAG: putative extracellular nuclease [Psychromonas sp.]|jgi:predicted extracellular nuclease|uniref:ExeM/NucH family extracellular endonuclease n=1 Tax=Psychromonas sp. TaxID=1884585 RepID=UPI0039E3CBA5